LYTPSPDYSYYDYDGGILEDRITVNAPPQASFSPGAGASRPGAVAEASPRSYFPETWLWQLLDLSLVLRVFT